MKDEGRKRETEDEIFHPSSFPLHPLIVYGFAS